MAVAVIVIDPVILAVHVHGNPTVGVIGGCNPDATCATGNMGDVSITTTVAFPCTCTETITGSATITITIAITHTITTTDF